MLGSSIQIASGNTLTSTAAIDIKDNILFTLGDDADGAMVLNSAGLAADTALTGVLTATVEAQAVAADSLLIANNTSNGDLALYINKGTNSQQVFWADGSTGNTAILAASGQSVDMYIGGSKIFDLTNDGTKSTLMGLSGDYWRIGDAATTNHSLNSEDDLMVTGELEVDGDAMFDGTTITFGVSSNVAILGGITMADTKAIKTPSGGTGDYFLLQAYDEDLTGLVEVARVFSANNPYIAFGGSQQFKYYNSGTALFGSLVTSDSATIEIGNAGVIKSGGTAADTLLIAADDTTFITLTSNATDTLDIGAHSLSGKLTAGANEIEGSNFDINGGSLAGVSTIGVTGNITGENQGISLVNFDGISAWGNTAEMAFDIAVSSGSATHDIILKIDANEIFKVRATGDGSGGVTGLKAMFTENVEVANAKNILFGASGTIRACDSINAIAYTQILEILGDCSMFLPFSEATGSTVTDWTANGLDATTSETLQTLDTPPAFVGSQYAYGFNGTDEEMDVADNALSSTAGAMSAGAWVNMTDSTNSTLFGVWDINSKREWRLYLDASDYPTFAVYDEGNAAQLGRQDQTVLSEGAWKFVVATFDGGTAAGGITVYIDGIALDDADVLVGSGYADQVDSGAALDIGFNEDGASAPENYFDGLVWAPWMTKKELSADEVWNLYKIGKGLLDQ